MRNRLTTPTGLRLRPWHERDAAELLDAFASDDMASQRTTALDTAGDATAWITEARQAWEGGTHYSWAVTAADAVLGSVSIGTVERRHETAWVSYWTHWRARGRGIAADSVTAAAGWAFDDLALFRLELGHRTNNPASCEVARRAGFAVEGLQRAKLRYGEDRYDVELHARLATDPVPGHRPGTGREQQTS